MSVNQRWGLRYKRREGTVQDGAATRQLGTLWLPLRRGPCSTSVHIKLNDCESSRVSKVQELQGAGAEARHVLFVPAGKDCRVEGRWMLPPSGRAAEQHQVDAHPLARTCVAILKVNIQSYKHWPTSTHDDQAKHTSSHSC